ncbi:MAG: LicD family protein [Lachnospiraceae bacterium]|nr:LicD family protein [Lachnospiraceae bacterium]
MNHNIDYFRDEVRNGFYVPTVVKQAWAMCLDILSEIDRICQKYGITYYADWGTFLGAVRHGGFVPWDDDMDICMKREDYIKFREVCDKELPAHFDIHDYERKEDHWLFLSRVVNNKKICYDEEYLEEHYNFPWLAAVDIFVKDYLYIDPEKEKARDKDVLFLVTIADGIREKSFKENVARFNLKEIENKYHVKLPDISKERELCIALYKLAEKRMAEVKENESEEIGQIYPWILRGDKGQPKNYYEDAVRLPFEDITIPVPARYNEFLTHRYGNFCEIHKIWWAHTYPFFESQKKEMERVNGAPIIDFAFDKSMLDRPAKENGASLKVITKECLTELKRLVGECKELLTKEDEYINLLTEMQQLAVDLGTLIEQVKGETKEPAQKAVSSLEKLCEAIFLGSSSKDVAGIEEALKEAEEIIEHYIIGRKEILFLSIGPEEWRGLAPVYEECIKDEDVDVYIVPLPILPKDPLGQVKMSTEDIEKAVHLGDYPENINYTSWKEYDIAQHCPEKIYIQNSYDERNAYLTVPPQYYAKNIRRYTDELIFIPFSPTSEFEEKDATDMYALKHYAVSPGVIYSDKAIVQSENIKKHYVNKLTEFAGEDTRTVWEQKITTEGFPAAKNTSEKGTILCIGVNELVEKGEELLDTIKDYIKKIKTENEGENITFTFYPDDRSQWDILNKDLAERVFKLIEEEAIKEGYGKLTLIPKKADAVASEYASYYGSASPLVPAFTIKGKQVRLFTGVTFN